MDKNLVYKIKSIIDKIVPASPEESDKDYWVYLAGNVVLTLFFINIFFWLLWALIVYKGGIFIKIIPTIGVVFTSKTLADFGYEGYPYEMGVFDGWPENVAALALTLAFIELCRRVYLRVAGRKIASDGKDSAA